MPAILSPEIESALVDACYCAENERQSEIEKLRNILLRHVGRFDSGNGICPNCGGTGLETNTIVATGQTEQVGCELCEGTGHIIRDNRKN